MTVWMASSATGQTSGIPATSASGVPDKMIGSMRYFVQMTSAAVAGLLYVIIRWNDRQGVARVHTSSALSLAGAARMSNEFEVYIEDTGIDGTLVSLEIQTVGVLGSFSYDYFFQVEGERGN